MGRLRGLSGEAQGLDLTGRLRGLGLRGGASPRGRSVSHAHGRELPPQRRPSQVPGLGPLVPTPQPTSFLSRKS